jgi:hypothetical protein
MNNLFAEYKQLFRGILSYKNFGSNFLGGLGVAFYSLIFIPPKEITITSNVFFNIIESVPQAFVSGFLLGYLWINAANNGSITLRKLSLLLPFVLVWLMVLILFA